jgi:hypothetical protein
LGRGEEVAPLEAVGGVLEVSLFCICLYKSRSGFEYLPYTISPLGMFCKEKEQLHIGDFCSFALPLAKQV